MIFNKYYILIIILFIFIGCEDDTYYDENCSEGIEGIEEVIEATSYTNWIYMIVTDTALIELEMTEEQAQNSLDWDLAMMRNHFRTNSGTSGPGDGGASMLNDTWSCEIFNEFSFVPENTTFISDAILTNIYQPWAHDDPNEAYTEAPGSTILENWGWFDIDNDYYFYYTHRQFIVKLPNNRGYIKIWPYQYYGELRQSAHTSLNYDFIQELD